MQSSKIGLTIISVFLLILGTVMCIQGWNANGYGKSGAPQSLNGWAVIYFGLVMAGCRVAVYLNDRKQKRKDQET